MSDISWIYEWIEDEDTTYSPTFENYHLLARYLLAKKGYLYPESTNYRDLVARLYDIGNLKQEPHPRADFNYLLKIAIFYGLSIRWPECSNKSLLQKGLVEAKHRFPKLKNESDPKAKIGGRTDSG